MLLTATLCATRMVEWMAVTPMDAMKDPTRAVLPPTYKLPPPVCTDASVCVQV
jgi:hypothetical protein